MNEHPYTWRITPFYGNCIVSYFHLKKKINELNLDFIGCHCKPYQRRAEG